jgi:hypothetical protein
LLPTSHERNIKGKRRKKEKEKRGGRERERERETVIDNRLHAVWLMMHL